jgi:hypothetical protein
MFATSEDVAIVIRVRTGATIAPCSAQGEDISSVPAIVMLEDFTASSMRALQQLRRSDAARCVLLPLSVDASSDAVPTQTEMLLAPDTHVVARIDEFTQASLKKLSHHPNRKQISREKMVLEIAQPAMQTDENIIREVEKNGAAWILSHSGEASAAIWLPLLRSLLAQSRLPIYCQIATCPAASPLLQLDLLSALPLDRIHILWIASSGSASTGSVADFVMLKQHWHALKQRQSFQRKQEEQQNKQAVVIEHQETKMSVAGRGASARINQPAAIASSAVPTAQYYRAAFTPPLVFFRLQM